MVSKRLTFPTTNGTRLTKAEAERIGTDPGSPVLPDADGVLPCGHEANYHTPMCTWIRTSWFRTGVVHAWREGGEAALAAYRATVRPLVDEGDSVMDQTTHEVVFSNGDLITRESGTHWVVSDLPVMHPEQIARDARNGYGYSLVEKHWGAPPGIPMTPMTPARVEALKRVIGVLDGVGEWPPIVAELRGMLPPAEGGARG
jgi:hypothetical protein